jgi:hypothetical protein
MILHQKSVWMNTALLRKCKAIIVVLTLALPPELGMRTDEPLADPVHVWDTRGQKKVDLFPISADYNTLRQREWTSAKGKAINNRRDFERGVLGSPQLSIRVLYVRLFLPSAAEKTAPTNWRLSRLASDYIYSLQFQTSSIISFAQSASLWVVDKCALEVKYIC